MQTSWVTTTIGEQATLQRGIDITQKQQTAGTVPVISSGGISSFHNVAAVSGPGVVLGRKGTVGTVFYVASDFWPHDTTLWVKDFHGNDRRFVYYFFRSITRNLSALDVGTANPTLNRNHVHPLQVEWPTLTEQRTIVEILGALDDKIELNRRMNRTLESTARAIFRSWFVDFDPVVAKAAGRLPFGTSADLATLFPDRFQEAEFGPLPDSWRIGTLRDCCIRVENGGTPRRDRPEFWLPAEVPWLTSAEVRQVIVTKTQNHISNNGLMSSSAKLWPGGTTVVALYGATAGQVCWLATEMCANQACCGLIPRGGWSSYVYLHVLSSVDALADQSRGSAQQNLSQEIVARFQTTLPSGPVVAEFEKMVRPIIGREQLNHEQSRTLAALRDTLLPKLMSGELRVRDAEKLVGTHV